jgi:hypothetical protein
LSGAVNSKLPLKVSPTESRVSVPLEPKNVLLISLSP